MARNRSEKRSEYHEALQRFVQATAGLQLGVEYIQAVHDSWDALPYPLRTRIQAGSQSTIFILMARWVSTEYGIPYASESV